MSLLQFRIQNEITSLIYIELTALVYFSGPEIYFTKFW